MISYSKKNIFFTILEHAIERKNYDMVKIILKHNLKVKKYFRACN